MNLKDKKFYVILDSFIGAGARIHEAKVINETAKTFTISYCDTSYTMSKDRLQDMPFFRTNTSLITDDIPKGIEKWNARIDTEVAKLSAMRINEKK